MMDLQQFCCLLFSSVFVLNYPTHCQAHVQNQSAVYLNWNQSVTLYCEYFTNDTASLEIWKHLENGTNIRLESRFLTSSNIVYIWFEISAQDLFDGVGESNSIEIFCRWMLHVYGNGTPRDPVDYNFTRLLLRNETADLNLTTVHINSDDGGGGREDNGMPEEHDKKLWIIAAVFGSIAVLLLIVAIVVCAVYCWYRKRKQAHNIVQASNAPCAATSSHKETLSEQCTDMNVLDSTTCSIIISDHLKLPVTRMEREDKSSVKESSTVSEPMQCSDKEHPTSTLCTASNVGVCSSQEVESLCCGERIVYDGAVNETKIGPELSSPLRVDSQPANEDTPFTIHTTTVAPKGNLRKRFNSRTCVNPCAQERNESKVWSISYFTCTAPPTEVVTGDEDTVYECDCDSQYSSAVQETPSKLPQKSTIVCGGGRPVISDWDYSDLAEEDCSFDRTNYVYCSEVTAFDGGIRYTPVPFPHFYYDVSPIIAQDLCNVPVNGGDTGIPYCPFPGHIAVTGAANDSVSGEAYHNEGATKDIKQYHSERVARESTASGKQYASTFPAATDPDSGTDDENIIRKIQDQDQENHTDLKINVAGYMNVKIKALTLCRHVNLTTSISYQSPTPWYNDTGQPVLEIPVSDAFVNDVQYFVVAIIFYTVYSYGIANTSLLYSYTSWFSHYHSCY